MLDFLSSSSTVDTLSNFSCAHWSSVDGGGEISGTYCWSCYWVAL
jgi:hypothetical protein